MSADSRTLTFGLVEAALHLLHVRGVALHAEADLLQLVLLEHLLGHVPVLGVLEELVQAGAVHHLAVVLAHLRRVLQVPFHDVVVQQHNDVTLPVSPLRKRINNTVCDSRRR